MSPSSSVRRTDSQWRAAINRNKAVAQASSLNGAIQIMRGRYFWPLQPNHPGNDFDIETIAASHARILRWGGQARERYTLAQHCVHVADIVQLNRKKLVPGWDWDNPDVSAGSPALLGLLHDSPEGYGFCDLTRPVEYSFDGYKEGEDQLMDKIIEEFSIPIDMAIREAVRRVDNMMIFLERDEFVGKPVVPYTNEQDHPRITIHDVVPDFYIWPAHEAEERFLERYAEIVTHAGNKIPREYLRRNYLL